MPSPRSSPCRFRALVLHETNVPVGLNTQASKGVQALRDIVPAELEEELRLSGWRSSLEKA